MVIVKDAAGFGVAVIIGGLRCCIVQEGLTNALKHAGHARTTARVRYGVDSLEIEIVDDGVGAHVIPQL